MINLIEQTITIRGKTEPIIRTEVWYMTGVGLVETFEQTVGLPGPVSAVPVAISETLYEVM